MIEIPSFPESWIDQQLDQYPETGLPGIGYSRGDMKAGLWVDCLLYRDDDGKVCGVLNHFPLDIPPYEKKGNFLILVRRDRRRHGIGTALLKEACKRWDISLEQQRYTKEGAQLCRAVGESEGLKTE